MLSLRAGASPRASSTSPPMSVTSASKRSGATGAVGARCDAGDGVVDAQAARFGARAFHTTTAARGRGGEAEPDEERAAHRRRRRRCASNGCSLRRAPRPPATARPARCAHRQRQPVARRLHARQRRGDSAAQPSSCGALRRPRRSARRQEVGELRRLTWLTSAPRRRAAGRWRRARRTPCARSAGACAPSGPARRRCRRSLWARALRSRAG